MFVLYEFPFEWFYQCIIMNEYKVDISIKESQDCVAFQSRMQYQIDNYQSVSASGFDDPVTYLRFVRGGYMKSDIDLFDQANKNITNREIDQARSTIQKNLYPDNIDKSYPQCSKNTIWQIGPYGAAMDMMHPYIPSLRALIWNWYDTSTCETDWQTVMIDGLSGGMGITRDNWKVQLTVADPLNLVPQDPSVTTLLDSISDIMKKSTGIHVVENIPSGDQRKGCLIFQSELPITFDFDSNPLDSNLIPSPQFNGYVVVSSNDDSVPHTCAFLPLDDPVFADLYSQSNVDGTKVDCVNIPQNETMSKKDTLVKCNGKKCSTVPLVWLREGKFNCRYVAEGGIIPNDCTESTPGCIMNIVNSMYKAIYDQYTPPPRSVLQVKAFPWFQSENSWNFQSFDMTLELNYEGNIQPNQQKSVMCQINTDESSALQFTTCQNPHYKTLKEHVKKYYKHDGSVVIPPGSQLEWKIDRGTLERGIIMAYSNLKRPLTQTYTDALFDDSTVCSGKVTGNQRVCWKKAEGKFTSINPWMLGEFNPFSICDVDYMTQSQGGSEFIYSFCAANNPVCTSFDSFSIPNQCNNLYRQLVPIPSVPRIIDNSYLDYNLCHHTLQEDPQGCMQDQGLLGGYDGLPVGAPADSINMLYNTKYSGNKYSVASNMYLNSQWDIPDDFNNGYFDNTNPLWSGSHGPYGFLRIKDTDIGGHRIGVSVTRNNLTSDTISTMSVEKLPFNTNEDDILLDSVEARSLPVTQWVSNLQAQMLSDHQANIRLYNQQYQPNDIGVSCPLQRWLFYSGSYSSFSPSIPSPRRTQHLFWRINKFKMGHPVMTQISDGRYLGEYKTSNGFCACPLIPDIPQRQCLAKVEQGRCSLIETIQSLQPSNKWFESFIYPPFNDQVRPRPCKMQLDWPNVNNMLRDGTTMDGKWDLASSPSNHKCHVLDRLRPFRYKYISTNTLGVSRGNNVQLGVCKTGRMVSIIPSLTQTQHRCVRTALAYNKATVTCDKDDTIHLLNRRTVLSTYDVVARIRQRRSKCSQCSKPPKFTTSSGKPMPPESSFGRLFSISAERLLAKDLRDTLCNVTGTCPKFNTSAWKRGEFIKNYLFYPNKLFVEKYETTTTTPLKPADDSQIWENTSWVYCPTVSSLKTGIGCNGKIPRDLWVRSKTKTCPSLVRSLSTLNGKDPMSKTHFCNIDNTTDAVCKAIAESRLMVIQANCISSGDPACLPTPFVYHPASYDRSNNEWIHDTISTYYRYYIIFNDFYYIGL